MHGPVVRKPRTAWKPGQSGNPGGKRALTENDRQAQYSARHYEPECISKLVQLMRFGESEAVQLGAVRELLDRARGRPPVAVLSAHVGAEVGPPDMSDMQGADVDRLADVWLAMISGQPTPPPRGTHTIEARALPVASADDDDTAWLDIPDEVPAPRRERINRKPK
jgi:hypothetical protein